MLEWGELCLHLHEILETENLESKSLVAWKEEFASQRMRKFLGNECFPDVDCDHGSTGINMSKCITLYSLNMFGLLYVNYTSIKLPKSTS